MATPSRDEIDTFMSITGASEAVAVQKLQEHLCNLNEAVNAHFNEGDRNTNETSVAALQNDFMDVDEPALDEPRRDPFSLLSAASDLNPFSLLDPNFNRSLLGQNSDFTSRAPFVSHPREVREIPIEVKDGNKPSSQSGHSITIEDITGTADIHGPETRGTVIIDDDKDDDNPTAQTARGTGFNEQKHSSSGDSSRGEHPSPSAPEFDETHDYGNDIEAEMIQAAIEASKQEVEGDCNKQKEFSTSISQQRRPPVDDTELAHAVSLSLKTAEQEKALREQGVIVGPSEEVAYQSAELERLGKSAALNGRLETGSSSIQGEAEETGLKSRHMSSSSTESAKEVGEAGPVVVSPPSSPLPQDIGNHSQASENAFHSDEWGGISSEEHDEAVMLEAAMFGGVPEDRSYGFPYAPHHFMRPSLNSTMGSYPRQPRPPSPSLEAQRLIREQQDDEYLASLQADREKELKAREEAEARHLMEVAAREAALEEERLKEEESRKKLEEEEGFEREIAAKEASLPSEPALDDENVVTLLVRMPDGSRRGRRFLKSDKLQSLFNFIDVGRGVKPGTYRLVRPYPRRAFSNQEGAATLNELGLTSKQEALFLELI